MTCSHPNCSRVAIYDSPQLFCGHHWAQWWQEDIDFENLSLEEKKFLEEERLQIEAEDKE